MELESQLKGAAIDEKSGINLREKLTSMNQEWNKCRKNLRIRKIYIRLN